MSKSSLTGEVEPYYRKFGKPAWYRKKPQFPDGRDPYTDLFKDEAIAEIISKIGIKHKTDARALQADLRDLAYDYLTAALTAPFGIEGAGKDFPAGLSRNERKRFLEPHVINPAQKLLDALADENAHKFFEWPDEKIGPDPDKEALIQELTHLIDRVSGVVEGLVERQDDSTDALTEFKMDFSNALSMVFKEHYPTLPAHVSPHDSAKCPSSEYFKFLRMCSKEIFKGELVLAVEVVDSVVKPRRKR